jgi:type I restriction enzyme, S subunit
MKLPQLPSPWKMQRVAELIAKFDAGVSVNGGDRPATEYECGVLKISAVTAGKFRPYENKVIDGAERNRVSLNPMRGRLIMSRANTPELVGASAYIDTDYPKLFLSDKLWQFEPREEAAFSMRWLGFVLGSPAYRRRMGEVATGSSQSMKNISQESVLQMLLPVPPLEEQCQIARLLGAWTSAIEKTEQLIAAKSQLLSHLREHHLTKPKQSRRIKLKAATRESALRNGTRLGRNVIMAVTKEVGMRPMREETIAAAIERYKVVKPDAFAYNPMRLNIGSIAISAFADDVLVSPDYVVFECDEAKLLPGYLNHLRRTRLWASHFEVAGSGGVRIRIYYDDLAAFAFPLPPLAEQRRLLAALDAGVAEIETMEHYLAALKTQKRGLMQKLLTGQWRVKAAKTDAP